MQDEEASVALLGVRDAAYLGGGGRLLLRLDGREAVELYGYQVPSEHLERLVRVMRSAYPSGPPPAAASAGAAEDRVSVETKVAAVEATDAPADTLDAPLEVTNAETETQNEPDAEVAAAARAPIEVICFGGPRVLCGGAQVWPRMTGGDAKPWELLLYVACQPVEGVSSEDAVEALWPEDESAVDPPHRFRQLRYRLRRALSGARGAPDADGICLERGVLRLDPGVVYSDAQEFLTVVRGARITPGAAAIEYLERARELYLGDLLQGPDAKRYAWVDERDPSGVTLREHFRRLYQQGCARLAELYASSGQLDAASRLYRELTELDPGDERLWLALFRLHVDRGDRLALVREEHRMREALHELALDSDGRPGTQEEDPSRETSQEYQRLLASLGDRAREPAAV
jgi:DNA-binding SARP family transcriptional activator